MHTQLAYNHHQRKIISLCSLCVVVLLCMTSSKYCGSAGLVYVVGWTAMPCQNECLFAKKEKIKIILREVTIMIYYWFFALLTLYIKYRTFSTNETG